MTSQAAALGTWEENLPFPELHDPAAMSLRRAGHRISGLEGGGEVGTRSHPAESRQRELSSLHRSCWGREAHELSAQALISPGKSRPGNEGDAV